MCPVTGCKNNGGLGYKDSYFSKHISAHNAILVQSAEEREKVTHALGEYGNNVLCKGCCRVVAHTILIGFADRVALSAIPVRYLAYLATNSATV